MIAVTRAGGLDLEPDELGAILDAQRRRFTSTFGAFDDYRWRQPSRCDEWDAHQVLRHVADAAELHLSGFTGQTPSFVDGETFNPNTTPEKWMAHSAAESPDATLERYDRAAKAVCERAVADLATGVDRRVNGPYGDAHWSTITVHILWDAWLHERDISLDSHGGSGELNEQQLVAMYAVLMACVPHAGDGHGLTGEMRLVADGSAIDVRFGYPDGELGTELLVRATSGHDDEPEVHGDLTAVVDSMAGRGGQLGEVLTGPPEVVEALAVLGGFLRG